MQHRFRDRLEPRWIDRVWRDAPGLICCCTSTDTPMYVCGGANSGLSTFYSTTDKVLWTAETASAVSSANLNQARFGAAGVSNPGMAGYIAGGGTSSSVMVATGDKITYSNDTAAALTTANLSQVRDQLAALSTTTTKGYYAGGSTNGGTAGQVKTADKLTFSGDSTAAVTTANLSQARLGIAGMTQGSTKGYFGGGATGSVITGTVVTAEKITFSSDTTAAQTTANLSAKRSQLQAGGDGSAAGYWCGGQTGASSTTVDKLTFSTDTTAAVTSASFDHYAGAMASNGSKLFAAGGNNSGGSAITSILKFTFATHVSSGITGTLSTGKELPAGVGYQGL